jgi:hypothetical protein
VLILENKGKGKSLMYYDAGQAPFVAINHKHMNVVPVDSL